MEKPDFFRLNFIRLIFLIATPIIIFHELGHFVAFRICDVNVEVVSYGFGPRLTGIKIGQTDYRISLIPLGGYVLPIKEEVDQMSVSGSIFAYLAGPITGIPFFLIIFLYLKRKNKWPWKVKEWRLEKSYLGTLAAWALIINALNLLPLMPLDGGHIFLVLLTEYFYSPSEYFMTVYLLVSFMLIIYIMFLKGGLYIIRLFKKIYDPHPEYIKSYVYILRMISNNIPIITTFDFELNLLVHQYTDEELDERIKNSKIHSIIDPKYFDFLILCCTNSSEITDLNENESLKNLAKDSLDINLLENRVEEIKKESWFQEWFDNEKAFRDFFHKGLHNLNILKKEIK